MSNPSPSSPNRLDYKILPATQSDCAAIAQVEALSNFNSSKTAPRCNPAQVIFPPPDDVSSRTKDFSEKTQNDPSMKIWKAVATVDGVDKIVAMTVWHFYPEPKIVDDWKDIDWPSNAQGEACNGFIRGMASLRKKHMSGKEFGRKFLFFFFFFSWLVAWLIHMCLGVRGVPSLLVRKERERRRKEKKYKMKWSANLIQFILIICRSSSTSDVAGIPRLWDWLHSDQDWSGRGSGNGSAHLLAGGFERWISTL